VQPPPFDTSWRRNNLGYHLFAANDRFLREKMAHMAAAGHGEVTEALLTLFVSTDSEGRASPTSPPMLG
jgi:hypothetical protein